jgi:hypothetical protein
MTYNLVTNRRRKLMRFAMSSYVMQALNVVKLEFYCLRVKYVY